MAAQIFRQRGSLPTRQLCRPSAVPPGFSLTVGRVPDSEFKSPGKVSPDCPLPAPLAPRGGDALRGKLQLYEYGCSYMPIYLTVDSYFW